MKFLSLIFVFCIGALIVQPTLSFIDDQEQVQEVCANACCSENNCSSGSGEEEESSPNGCSAGGICNPFQSCACCFGFSVENSVFEILSDNNNVNYIQPVTKKVHFGYSSDCFHPPEMIGYSSELNYIKQLNIK